MVKFDGKQVSEEAKALFSQDVTPEQCRWLVKVIKHCRGRCRSNAALRNWLKGAFPGLLFKEVTREWKGKPYPALEIHDGKGKQAPALEEPDEGGDMV